MNIEDYTDNNDFGVVFETTPLQELLLPKEMYEYTSDETKCTSDETVSSWSDADDVLRNKKRDANDLSWSPGRFLTEFGHFHEVSTDSVPSEFEVLSNDTDVDEDVDDNHKPDDPLGFLPSTSTSNNTITDDDDEDEDPKPMPQQQQTQTPKPIECTSSKPTTECPSGSNGNGSALTAATTIIKQVKFRAYQAENWTEKFEQLLRFREDHGHCLVPNFHPENQALAQWAKRQRYQYKLKLASKRSTITDERVKALDEVGFVWGSHEAIWSERLEELKKFRHDNAHCNVPCRYKKNQQLALWVKRQRRQWKKKIEGLPSSLTDERQEALDSIGFVWDMRKGRK
mmetsp:Transcript_5024/g.12869  ORF Transcript_5024/g.12869 Transcript_5024/m.12869 type:complete len:342 (+) Transcript_5024:191-1216(+)|eukprot:CAMPEP_0197174704 /NCGR_PEP_ID=MMETSP1423-20130617/1099_1 /TAXON_ID=476441 /ORGANISM="Pseudo-nitzschia heimii, Strain UNC1101" /LENGTH=341 /DNA_ID=CAMNT_0042623649 /DNA_START=143 /DNA_END=1168 /DNA_ORIENTATION=+